MEENEEGGTVSDGRRAAAGDPLPSPLLYPLFAASRSLSLLLTASRTGAAAGLCRHPRPARIRAGAKKPRGEARRADERFACGKRGRERAHQEKVGNALLWMMGRNGKTYCVVELCWLCCVVVCVLRVRGWIEAGRLGGGGRLLRKREREKREEREREKTRRTSPPPVTSTPSLSHRPPRPLALALSSTA
jgi:hypothetical protein